ncbi:MAG: hypothetical protein AABW79_00015 [Nanoarchaeota archaeon]
MPENILAEKIFGKCVFCNLGDAEKRNVVEKTFVVPPMLGYEDRGSSNRMEYSCGLGDIGKDCVIPRIVQMSYEGVQLGSQDSPRRIG